MCSPIFNPHNIQCMRIHFIQNFNSQNNSTNKKTPQPNRTKKLCIHLLIYQAITTLTIMQVKYHGIVRAISLSFGLLVHICMALAVADRQKATWTPSFTVATSSTGPQRRASLGVPTLPGDGPPQRVRQAGMPLRPHLQVMAGEEAVRGGGIAGAREANIPRS